MQTAEASSILRWHAAALLGGVVLLTGCQTATTQGIVALRAQADPAYVARHAQMPAPAADSYVFMKGQFYPSMFDGQVKRVDFDALTRSLAANLAPRFSPARSTADADLVIVVHWGAVERPQDSTETMMYDPDAARQANETVSNARTQAAADFKAGNYMASNQAAAAEAQARSDISLSDSTLAADARAGASTADLLGLRGLYAANDVSREADELRALLDDDRFFVTLIALDAKALRQKQRRVAWSVRMSVPVAGLDFATAVQRMGTAAAPFYGTQQRGMVFPPPVGPVQPAR